MCCVQTSNSINLFLFFFTELLTVYCKLLQAPPHGFDRFVLARVIHVVSNGASQQCDIRGKVLLPILTSYFHNIRLDLII